MTFKLSCRGKKKDRATMLCKAQIIKRSSFSVSASIMETITGL